MFTPRVALLVLTVLALPGCASLKPTSVTLVATSLYAPIHGTDIHGKLQGLRLDVSTNQFLGIPDGYGQLDLSLEAFAATTFEPQLSAFGGITPMLRYSYPISPWCSPYLEGGAGPIFLGFSTHEQEEAGFNFFDQVGAGFDFRLTDTIRLLVGYRFGHISHARLRPVKNKGIETQSALVGIVVDLP